MSTQKKLCYIEASVGQGLQKVKNLSNELFCFAEQRYRIDRIKNFAR